MHWCFDSALLLKVSTQSTFWGTLSTFLLAIALSFALCLRGDITSVGSGYTKEAAERRDKGVNVLAVNPCQL